MKRVRNWVLLLCLKDKTVIGWTLLLAVFAFTMPVLVFAEDCGPAGCSSDAPPVSHQTGWFGACDNQNLVYNVPTRVSADNWGSYAADRDVVGIPWGSVTITNTAPLTTTVTNTVCSGRGCVSSDSIMPTPPVMFRIDFLYGDQAQGCIGWGSSCLHYSVTYTANPGTAMPYFFTLMDQSAPTSPDYHAFYLYVTLLTPMPSGGLYCDGITRVSMENPNPESNP